MTASGTSHTAAGSIRTRRVTSETMASVFLNLGHRKVQTEFTMSHKLLGKWPGAGVAVYLAGSCRARYGAMVQARLMWSFHCFSDMLLYLDLQFAMLVSSDGSVAMASSGADSGLYHMVSRSISLACRDTVREGHLI